MRISGGRERSVLRSSVGVREDEEEEEEEEAIIGDDTDYGGNLNVLGMVCARVGARFIIYMRGCG